MLMRFLQLLFEYRRRLCFVRLELRVPAVDLFLYVLKVIFYLLLRKKSVLARLALIVSEPFFVVLKVVEVVFERPLEYLLVRFCYFRDSLC